MHHAWGDLYRAYLKQHDVPDEHVFVNGRPSYRLYAEPYRRFFADRSALAKAFSSTRPSGGCSSRRTTAGRSPSASSRSSCLWGETPRTAITGGLLGTVLRASLASLSSGSDGRSLEVILRPPPSVNTTELLDFFRQRLGDDTGRHPCPRGGLGAPVDHGERRRDLLLQHESDRGGGGREAGLDVRADSHPGGFVCR